MTRKRLIAGLLIVVVAVTMSFVVLPDEVYAATKKPAKVVLTSVKSADHNAIKITWKKAKNAKKYQVWRATAKNGKYKLIKTTTAKTFTNKKLITGKKYYYKVRAINGSQKGKFSIKKYATPKLKRTTNVKIAVTETTAKVSWNKVNGAKGYQIYRAETKNGTYKKVNTTSKLSFTNKGLAVNKGYYYKVRAYKKVNGKFKYGNFSTVKYIKTQDHNYQVVQTVASTCTGQGYSIKKCVNCGSQVKYGYKASLGHNFKGTEVITKAPTCTDWGKKTVQCTRCTAKVTKDVASLGHVTTGQGTIVENPTCTDCGIKVVGCDRCGEGIESTVPALGHDYKNGTETGRVAPTCTEDGARTVQCARCDSVKKEAILATGHNYAIKKDITATCTTEGYTKYTCANSGCGHSKEGNRVAALGHDWFVEKTPEGNYEEQCSRAGCGAVQDHNHKLQTVTRDKTADELKLGYYEYTTVEYYGCQECKAQLLYSADGKEVNAFEVFVDSDPAVIAKAQAAHNKFHAPDGVTPTYGIIVEEQSDPVWVSQEDSRVIEGHQCSSKGCDYYESHLHNCSKPVELPTSNYKLVSSKVGYIDRLNCPGCIETIGDFSCYTGSLGGNGIGAHKTTHILRGERDATGNARFVYDVKEYHKVYRSVTSSETDHRMCSTDGCSYID